MQWVIIHNAFQTKTPAPQKMFLLFIIYYCKRFHMHYLKNKEKTIADIKAEHIMQSL